MGDLLNVRIYQTLSAHAGVSGIVGGRIYDQDPAQGSAMPFIFFSVNSDEAVPDLESVLGPDLSEASVEIQCIAIDSVKAAELGKQVRLALDGAANFDCTDLVTRQDFNQFDRTYTTEIDADVWYAPEA